MTEATVAAVVVRNTASHDARVLRCARTLQSLGYETVVVAVTSAEEPTEHAVAQGVPIVRLTPAAPLAGVARRLRGHRSRSGSEVPADATASGAGSGVRRAAIAPRAYRLARTLSYYRRGIAAMRRLRPEVVHCNDYNTMWIGVAAKLLAGSSLVYDSHELWPDRNGRSEPRWWLLACEAFFLRIADGTLATSPGHAEAIARRHRVEPPRVVRNIAERRAANGAARGSGPGQTGPRSTLVYVGAVTGGRGLEQAIDALTLAPEIGLRIIGPGNGSYSARLRALAERNGVADRVRLVAAVPPERVVEEVATAAAGVALIQPSCLSYALSLPNKLFEYLAGGVPILAADVPTIRAFVERNEVGLIAPHGDPEAIAAAMREIVDPERNLHLRQAVAAASARLTWERESRLLERAYREATEIGAGR